MKKNINNILNDVMDVIISEEPLKIEGNTNGWIEIFYKFGNYKTNVSLYKTTEGKILMNNTFTFEKLFNSYEYVENNLEKINNLFNKAKQKLEEQELETLKEEQKRINKRLKELENGNTNTNTEQE